MGGWLFWCESQRLGPARADGGVMRILAKDLSALPVESNTFLENTIASQARQVCFSRNQPTTSNQTLRTYLTTIASL